MSLSDQSRSKARPDRQSPALNSARTVFLLTSNLGNGSFNVPGLQAAGQLGIQIIDIIKKIKGNKTNCEELVACVNQLLDPIWKMVKNQKARDIDLYLKEDLQSFTGDLEKIQDILQLQANQSLARRAMNSVGNGEDIIRFKELVNQGFKRFEVYTAIAL
ncbi:hypothetical protein PILCRDRAFT_15657 [Piloderma croceum F 1598]|uniref:Uncharacterized protein n=1 Tax=Piloderma croceum (strain F 1598) TaxID=765440 RepID=A0A0C3AGN1_PILCF|nr:hypothetical protein PILCRDRAFT_15657 [Piloderma croceum F 1598]